MQWKGRNYRAAGMECIEFNTVAVTHERMLVVILESKLYRFTALLGRLLSSRHLHAVASDGVSGTVPRYERWKGCNFLIYQLRRKHCCSPASIISEDKNILASICPYLREGGRAFYSLVICAYPVSRDISSTFGPKQWNWPEVEVCRAAKWSMSFKADHSYTQLAKTSFDRNPRSHVANLTAVVFSC